MYGFFKTSFPRRRESTTLRADSKTERKKIRMGLMDSRLRGSDVLMVLLITTIANAQFTTNLGNKYSNLGVHPGYTLTNLRPDGFDANVGGIDTLSGGRLAVATLQEMPTEGYEGGPGSPLFRAGLFILNNWKSLDKSQITVDTIALTLEDHDGYEYFTPFAEDYTQVYRDWEDVHPLDDPTGLLVMDDVIYVLEATRISMFTDINGDGSYAKKDTIGEIPWGGGYWENPHDLQYKDGKFWFAKTTAVIHGGQRDVQHVAGNGSVSTMDMQGNIEVIMDGFRAPGGLGFGPRGEMFVMDNQGIWNPPNEIHHVVPGRFHGHYMLSESVQPVFGDEPVSPTTVMVPQGDLAKSLGTPVPITQGVYSGQMLVADMGKGSVKRVFLEEVNGDYQGAVFGFSGGWEAGPFRLKMLPDGSLLAGDMGACCSSRAANWGGRTQGVDIIVPNNTEVFDILAVRSRSNGLELEFTMPVEDAGGLAASYKLERNTWTSTSSYGGGKVDNYVINISNGDVMLSDDKTRVYIDLPLMDGGKVVYGLNPNFDADKYNYIYYIGVDNSLTSAAGDELWSTDAWYTLNNISDTEPFEVTAVEREEFDRINKIDRIKGGQTVSIVFQTLEMTSIIEIYHPSGKRVYQGESTGQKTWTLNEQLGSGVYQVRTSSGGTTQTQSVFIY